jgi:hypothetical protein
MFGLRCVALRDRGCADPVRTMPRPRSQHPLTHMHWHPPTAPNAVKCYRCGSGNHSSKNHFFCKGAHEVAERYDYRPKCLLCGETGHYYRSRACRMEGGVVENT